MIIFALELMIIDPNQEVYNYTSLQLISNENRYLLENDYLSKIYLPSTSPKIKTVKNYEKENRKRKHYELEDNLDVDIYFECKKFKKMTIDENKLMNLLAPNGGGDTSLETNSTMEIDS
jgi:hypothetical protein